MKKVMFNVDEKLYHRMKFFNYSWNEVLAIGIRAKQMVDAANGTKEMPQPSGNKDECEVM